ncbi:hypothetical protein [Avrilella dinanensis]|uniref:YARHG domain-containing protein n=1 Tax=Avrilella dinanensis TaxID=2008672 RepID=A0A2M9R527_9FLAO|nr:hypothetical protein [Avrilella dinanensis]PJR03967.1 hypothetical protein CDL10_05065 [Avrilella dinanensis]
MRKLFYVVISLISVSALAQTKQVEFTQKLTYKINLKDSLSPYYEDYNNISYNHYIGKNKTESLISIYYKEFFSDSTTETNLFVKDEWMIPITVSGISKAVSYSIYSASKLIPNNKTVSKMDRKGSFDGIDCQYYGAYSVNKQDEEPEFCFCIDEDNEINNANILFPGTGIEGLIVSVEESRDGSFNMTYQSVENTNLVLDFNTDKMLADIEEYKTEQEPSVDIAESYSDDVVEAYDYSEYESRNAIYNDPLYSYGTLNDYTLYNYVYPVYGVTANLLYNTEEYSYNKSEAKYTREQVLKFFKKNTKNLVKDLSSSKLITSEEKKTLNDFFTDKIKEAEKFEPEALPEVENTTDYYADYAVAAADSVVYADYDYNYYTKYQSQYKDIDVADISLAYDLLSGKELKQNAPDYCDDLKNKIPDFKNKDLKNHVHNFAGQICDLYLYQNGGSVDYYGTINSMRKSLLEIEKMRNNLSKNDKKLLVEFLKNLD